jgi:hypothetical protein
VLNDRDGDRIDAVRQILAPGARGAGVWRDPRAKGRL